MKKPARIKVVFVCIGNACRSPMAEAIARQIGADVIEASSAGVTPLGRIEAMTKQTLNNNGYPSEGLTSKPLWRAGVKEADLVINMSGPARINAFVESAKIEDWDVEDPYGADGNTYQRIFKEIEQRVANLADRLRERGSKGKKAAIVSRKGSGDRQ